MLLRKINLLNFKNYTEINLEFPDLITCFVGHNGGGKTNLLDAIYYLSLTKSAFNPTDSQNILHGEAFFMLKGTYLKQEKEEVLQCNQKIAQKKRFLHNGIAYQKIAGHIGEFPIVLIAPNDTDIIRDSSDSRRKFIDGIISQLDRKYLEQLIQYNHVIKQRNAALKLFADRNQVDHALLDQYDAQLVNLGKSIYEKRVDFLSNFIPYVENHYQHLSDREETINLLHQSHLEETDYAKLLKQNRQKDLLLQRTRHGIHKDDFIFEIEGHLLKRFGSQGQQKSFLIALKLAHFDVIKDNKGFKPILLLDDIFDKLDDQRIQKLLLLVADGSFGQLFITDARPERTIGFMKKIKAKTSIFEVDKGIIKILA